MIYHDFSIFQLLFWFVFAFFATALKLWQKWTQEDMNVSLVSFIHHTFPCFQHSEATLFLHRTKLLDLNSHEFSNFYCLIDLRCLMIAALNSIQHNSTSFFASPDCLFGSLKLRLLGSGAWLKNARFRSKGFSVWVFIKRKARGNMNARASEKL